MPPSYRFRLKAAYLPLPLELVGEVLLCWVRDDPPIVNAETGYAKELGWVKGLSIDILRQELLRRPDIFAKNLTALPVAFPRFLDWSRDCPLHIVLSKNSPKLSGNPAVSRRHETRGVDLWGTIMSRPDVIARVQFLRLELSSIVIFSRSGDDGVYPAGLCSVEWPALEAADLYGVIPSTRLRAPRLQAYLLYSSHIMRSRDKRITPRYLAYKLKCYKHTLQVLRLAFLDERSVGYDSFRDAPYTLENLWRFELGPISSISAFQLLRVCKIPNNITFASLDIVVHQHEPETYPGVIDTLDCMHGSCSSFRVRLYRETSPLEFSFEVEGWRAGGLIARQKPNFKLTFEFPSYTHGPIHALAYLINKMSEGCEIPEVLFIDMSLGLTTDVVADWDALDSAPHVRFVEPYTLAHSYIRLCKTVDAVVALRRAQRKKEKRAADHDENLADYTRREEKELMNRDLLFWVPRYTP